MASRAARTLKTAARAVEKTIHRLTKLAYDQTMQVLQALRKRPDSSPDKGLILGQSFGGTIAIGVAALNPPGIQATINFAGGGGGNPETNPLQPCGTANLEQMFSTYGKSSKTNTLWVYTENDQWMGPKYPKEWFEAYKAKSGSGEFLFLPPTAQTATASSPATPQPGVLRYCSL